MSTETHRIIVNGLAVEVVRKAIKNLHLGVYPPHGRVWVAVPLAVSNDAVRLAVIDKLGWIKRQKAKFEAQPRQSRREMVSGESHYFQGRRYRLRVVDGTGSAKVVLRSNAIMELHVSPAATMEQRERVLQRWYREQLKKKIPLMLEKWQPVLSVKVVDWGIKKMKTKWGSCNVKSQRIWLNLELAKKPVKCLEYIVVHEMVHLIERNHNDRFKALIDKFMPRWRVYREELKRMPLGHGTWVY